MQYRRYTPPPPLAAFVDCLWYSEGFEGTHQRELLLPNGESGIVFDLRVSGPRQEQVRIYDAQDSAQFETFEPAVFCGSRTDCFVIDTSRQERVAGIQFRPGGAFCFLGMPASEVANGNFSLSDIWPGEASLLREALLSAPTIDAIFAILEGMLLSRLRNSPLLHPAVSYALACLSRRGSLVQVQQVVDRIGLSARHMTALFREQTGLTPKAFQRVRRFQHVLKSMRRNSEEQFAELAAGCGYYDQAHFIHDFRHFSGMTPGEYIQIATPHLNHVPLI